jgi:hypothetical protein
MLGRYDATRLPRAFVGDLWNERVIMGNAAVAQELLPGSDELDELYRLDASEIEPEEPEEDDEDEDDDENGDGDGGGPFDPEDRPHP